MFCIGGIPYAVNNLYTTSRGGASVCSTGEGGVKDFLPQEPSANPGTETNDTGGLR